MKNLLDYLVGANEEDLALCFGIEEQHTRLCWGFYADYLLMNEAKKFIYEEVEHVLEHGKPKSEGFSVGIGPIMVTVAKEYPIEGEVQSFLFGMAILAAKTRFEGTISTILQLFSILMMMKKNGMEEKDISEHAEKLKAKLNNLTEELKEVYDDHIKENAEKTTSV